MNIFLSAANDWNVIDICNKFLFVKLEFIAFISLLQNNRAGIPLNLLIKKKKKTFLQNFFQYTSRNETNRKKQKIYNPSSYSFNPLSIISIHPSSRFPWDMEHMLNIRPNLRLVLHFLKQQCIQRFQFPHQRLPHSIDLHHPFSLLRSSFPQESHGQLPRGLRLPTFICIKPDRKQPPLNLGVNTWTWIVQRRIIFYVCMCVYVYTFERCAYILIHILMISRLIYGCSDKLYRNNNTVCRLFFVKDIWVNINMPCSYVFFTKLQTYSKIKYSNNFSM